MNYTVLRVWGIPIRVNISLVVFLPILAWLIGSGEQLAAYATVINSMTPATVAATDLGAIDRWIIGTAAAVGLFASVAIHELGHAWVAMRYDITVKSITLWLLGGLAHLGEVPKQWDREFWIAIAGPITSLLVGIVCIGALSVIPASATVVVFAVGFLAVMNIVMAVFNMLPAFPLDGGRVLRALLSRKHSYVSATRTAARAGTGFAIVFIVLGIFVFSPILILIALFIYVAATTESRTVVLDALLSGVAATDLLDTPETVPVDATVDTVVPRLLSARRTDLAVVDETGTIVGAITAPSLRSVRPAEYDTTTVGDIMTTDLPRVDSETSAFDALQALRRSPAAVAFVERDGTLVGVLSKGDFAAVIDVRRDTEPF